MYPKNIRFYLIEKDFFILHTADYINQSLQENPLEPLTAMQSSGFGWAPAFKDSELFCEVVAGKWIINAMMKEKIIPAVAVNELLAEKIDQVEQEQGRKVSRKERLQFKEDITAEILPTALQKTISISAWIDPERGILAVCAASEARADEFTSKLREAIDILPVAPAHGYVHHDLTEWWLDPSTRPGGSELMGDIISLKLLHDNTVKASFKNHDLNATEIKTSIESGMIIEKLKISFSEQMSFVIDETLSLKQIKYCDSLIENGAESDDPRADCILMLDTVCNWCDAIRFENSAMKNI
jgi:recombination associated protein RdgC